MFSELQKQIGLCLTSLKPLCPTRWTVRTAALSAVLNSYRTLQSTLEQIKLMMTMAERQEVILLKWTNLAHTLD